MTAGRLNPDADPVLSTVGNEGELVVVIDDAALDPGALVEAAATGEPFAPAYGPAGGYPGVRAPAPLDYVQRVVRALDPLLRDAFGLRDARPARAECFFSLVTLPADALVASQREPHVDTDDPMQFAIMHYLCDGRFGGTDFYRHRATGFETLRADRMERYQAARAQEASGEGQGYLAGDDARFERIGGCDAVYNRLVAYRSRLLHSGRILPDAPLSPDPRAGRLTANIFLTYRAG